MPLPAETVSLLNDLAGALSGNLVRAGDDGWDAARSAWNLAIDQNPVAVAVPDDTDDVARVLAAARKAGLGVTVQPRGHGASGDLDGCILIRPSAFDEVTINAEKRFARVGAGVSWGSLLPHLEGTELIALAGTNTDVSVTGFLLSGGHSWFSRWKGLAAHSIRAVELVDAQGALRRLSAPSKDSDGAPADDADAELLWALRGGGGLFGVVIALEIDLYPAPSLFGGNIMFPGAAAETVFEQVAAVMSDAPRELSIFFGMINLPDLPFVPEPMRGQTVAAVDVVFVGTAQDAAPLLAPLLGAAPVLADQTGPFTISKLGDVAAEPQEPSGALDWSAAITELDGGGLADMAAAFRTASAGGLTLLQLRPLGGAVAEPGADATGVAGHLESDYLAFAAAIQMTPGLLIDARSALGPLAGAVDARTVLRTVPSLLSHGEGLESAYPPETLARLAAVKRVVDPGNLFRSNRPLPIGS